MELKPSKAYVEAITAEVADLHWRRMGRISASAMHDILIEQKKENPDQARINSLQEIARQAGKDRGDVSVTIRDVVNPMRSELGMEPLQEDSFRFEPKP